MKKKRVKKVSFWKYIMQGVVILLFLLFIVVVWYLNDYYKADSSVNKYLRSSDTVVVDELNGSYFFDGYGEDNAIIFYQGAKVDNKAYAPLLYKLAENGIDCFLINMPYRLAILDQNKASSIIYDKYDYKNWYLMGHSLGGYVASNYVISHEDDVKGLILLASYSTKKINNSIKVLSIYGSVDGVMNFDKYEKYRENLPNNALEIIIEGGNHSNFGYYGTQKSDNESTITREVQQELTVEEIVKFINNNN